MQIDICTLPHPWYKMLMKKALQLLTEKWLNKLLKKVVMKKVQQNQASTTNSEVTPLVPKLLKEDRYK